ncbi:MAG: hypothetical protein QOD36_2892, partial [Mycobacterium sp.]|nr:hypothetical protein [Mycobacterium sp.]
ARAGALQAALGRDDQIVRIGMKRLGDEVLGNVGTVGDGGVDEVHAELDGATQHANAFVTVSGRAPYTVAGDAHGTEPQAVDREVAADGECS